MDGKDVKMSNAPEPSQSCRGGAAMVTGPKFPPRDAGAPPKPDAGKVRSVTIRQAEGGFIMDIDRESRGRGGLGGGMPAPRVAPDIAAVHAALDEAFGGGAPKAPVVEESVTVTEGEPPALPPQFNG